MLILDPVDPIPIRSCRGLLTELTQTVGAAIGRQRAVHRRHVRGLPAPAAPAPLHAAGESGWKRKDFVAVSDAGTEKALPRFSSQERRGADMAAAARSRQVAQLCHECGNAPLSPSLSPYSSFIAS